MAHPVERARARAGLSREKLAEESGVSVNVIVNVESNRRNTTDQALGRLLDAVSATDEERLEALRIAAARASGGEP